jgi:hypothetical protein
MVIVITEDLLNGKPLLVGNRWVTNGEWAVLYKYVNLSDTEYEKLEKFKEDKLEDIAKSSPKSKMFTGNIGIGKYTKLVNGLHGIKYMSKNNFVYMNKKFEDILPLYLWGMDDLSPLFYLDPCDATKVIMIIMPIYVNIKEKYYE